MDCEELSDLEEGEIFEYESSSSSNDFKNNVYGRGEYHTFKSESSEKWPLHKKEGGNNLSFLKQGENGYIKNTLNEKNRRTCRELSQKSKFTLDYVSSDGEYKSCDDEKMLSGEGRHVLTNGIPLEGKLKKHSGQLSYGMVEDIMCEIGETISRKSHCNYRRRKSREVNYNLEKLNSKGEILQNGWSQKVFSSHFSNVRSKKQKRKVSCSDSDSEPFPRGEVPKSKRCRRKKKRKKKEIYHHIAVADVTKQSSNKQVRDFDEMRKDLLEKLKKRKAEEELGKLSGNTPLHCEQEMENSDIQEVEMLIDCTNYVDNPPTVDNEKNLTINGNESMENGGEEELDVIKLRLIALESNRSRRNSGTLSKDEISAERKSDDSSRDVENDRDMDRSELLLRAEALKTALLKKHQKRLIKLKEEKLSGLGSSSDNDGLNPPSPVEAQAKGKSDGESKESVSSAYDVKLAAEVQQKVVEAGDSETGTNCSIVKKDIQNNINEADVIPNINLNVVKGRVRGKRKKKKSESQPSKENVEKSDVQEEDDRTLRSQLLSDLMKKKSLKDQGGKMLLMESYANKPLANEEEQLKRIPVKRNSWKKSVPSKPTSAIVKSAIPKPEIQRIIVHLGSEDSSEGDLEVEEDGQVENGGDGTRDQPAPEQVKGDRIESAPATRQTDVIQAGYEKSVELLLSQARKKIEGEMQSAKKNPLNTPEAVYKHLPPSQRLEYMRLKQKIAERERLRKMKIETPSSAFPSTPSDTLDARRLGESTPVLGTVTKPVTSSVKKPVPCKNFSPTSNYKNVNGVCANGKPYQLCKKINTSSGLPKKSIPLKTACDGKVLRSTLLLPSSQALIAKLKLLLKKIKIEKCLEENYEKEMVKLKTQLNLFEKKRSEQKFKIKKLAEESMKIYKIVQGITNSGEKETPKKEEALKEEGKKAVSEEKVIGEEKEEINEAKGEDEPEKEANENPVGGKANENPVDGKANENATTRGELLEYSSPLEVFNKVSDNLERVDPNVIMCQFDLMGVCKDEGCLFQHYRTS